MTNAWNTKQTKIVLLSGEQIDKILYETEVNCNIRYGTDSSEARAVKEAFKTVNKFIKDGKADAIVLSLSEELVEKFHGAFDD